MDFLHCNFEVKIDGSNSRTFIGHGSTFGNVDSYGDTVAKGAFTKTIADCKSGASPWPSMMLNHAGQPIGAWLDFSEDTKGLRMQGKLADTEAGNTVYELLKMKPRAALSGLSIGYVAKDSVLHKKGQGPGGALRTLKAVDLKEISVVTFPADGYARISSVKAEWLDEEPVVDEAESMKQMAAADWQRMSRLAMLNGRTR
jgi:hypothetical protein